MGNTLNQYSSCCGRMFEGHAYPWVCACCGNQFWDNPTPVVVVLLPVLGHGHTGLVVIRRAIPPCVGELALPGGFLEIEPWRVGAARELREEGVAEIASSVLRPFTFFPFASSTNNRRVLLFSIAPPVYLEDLPPFRPNQEVSERVIIWEPTELCFTTHTQAVFEFFAT